MNGVDNGCSALRSLGAFLRLCTMNGVDNGCSALRSLSAFLRLRTMNGVDHGCFLHCVAAKILPNLCGNRLYLVLLPQYEYLLKHVAALGSTPSRCFTEFRNIFSPTTRCRLCVVIFRRVRGKTCLTTFQ